MSEIKEDFVLPAEDEGQPQEEAPEETAPEVAEPAVVLLDEVSAETPDEGGEPAVDPTVERINKLEESFRELQGFSTRQIEANKELRKRNEELEALLQGPSGDNTPTPDAQDDDAPMTRKEFLALMNDPDFQTRVEQTKQQRNTEAWQQQMSIEIATLQKNNIGVPGTRFAKEMETFFTQNSDALVGDPDAVVKAVAYARQQLSKTAPAATAKDSVPAATGGKKSEPPKSEAGKEIVGDGIEAFNF